MAAIKMIVTLAISLTALFFGINAFTQVDRSHPIEHKINFIAMEDGIKLETIDWGGSGEALIFLSGMSLNAHNWDYFAPKFTHNYHVIGITRAGHGYSNNRKHDYSTARLAKDILAVLDHYKINKAFIAGHSFSGSEMTYLAGNYSNRLKGLIYIDALQNTNFLDDVIDNCPLIDDAIINYYLHKDHFILTQRTNVITGGTWPFADFDALDYAFEQALAPNYKDIETPSLSINYLPERVDDLFFGEATSNQACSNAWNRLTYTGIANFSLGMKNSDIVMITNSQHMIHMFTPDKLYDIMNDWLIKVTK